MPCIFLKLLTINYNSRLQFKSLSLLRLTCKVILKKRVFQLSIFLQIMLFCGICIHECMFHIYLLMHKKRKQSFARKFRKLKAKFAQAPSSSCAICIHKFQLSLLVFSPIQTSAQYLCKHIDAFVFNVSTILQNCKRKQSFARKFRKPKAGFAQAPISS